MFDDSERLWLHNPETGGHFHCPIDAVEYWKGRGFVESDPPIEVDPALVEHPDYVAQQQEKVAAKKAAKAEGDSEPAAKTPTKATKSTAAAKSEEK